MVTPTKDYILVELKDEYEHIAVTEQKYDTKTKGVCKRVGDPEHKRWVGKVVYWESYKDDTKTTDGLAFIKTEFVMGYEGDTDAE